jgi:hypothetical protein
MRAATAYDPFDREAEREAEVTAAAREEHQLWSLDQARKGRSAMQRENVGTWIKRAPDLPDLPPADISPSQSQELAAWAQSPGS